MVKFFIEREKKADQSSTAKAKYDCSQKTDSSVEIQNMSAVVPPSDAPSVLQKKTGQIFQNCAQQHGQQKYGHRSFSYAAEKQTEQKAPGSVNRKVRSFVYTSVDKSVFRDKKQQHFPEPPCKGDNEKKKDIKIETVGRRFFIHVFRMSDS